MLLQPAIIVVGSLNMDVVVRVSRIPTLGETVLGHDLTMIPGGKGGNQAFAAARLGANVAMVGKVGDDAFGRELKQNLSRVGVEVACVWEEPDTSSGVALICVEPSGNNAIAVAPGANQLLRPADLDRADHLFAAGRLLLIQLETPMDTVAHALSKAKGRGMTSILDPAPAVVLPPNVLARIDILTPNESEAWILWGRNPGPMSLAEAQQAACALQKDGAKTIVLKLGENGALLTEPDRRSLHFPACQVQAVDTTAAGDVFNGAMAVALSEGKSIEPAVRFANAAAALSTTRPGAQSSIPDRDAVVRVLGGN